MFLDSLKLSVQKRTPSGLIITNVMLFLMDCIAIKSDYNQDIKARISVLKVIQT